MENFPNEPGAREPSVELPTQPFESAETGERERIDDLPALLGYSESLEMAEIRSKWIEAARLGRPEEAREQAIAYQEQAEAADAARLAAFGQGRDMVLGWLSEGGTSEDAARLVAEAAELGFVETNEMRVVRAQIALARSQGLSEAGGLTEYEHLTNALESRSGAQFQIGLLIQKATVYRDAGQADYYEADLADAAEYANNMGLDWIVDRLESDTDEP